MAKSWSTLWLDCLAMCISKPTLLKMRDSETNETMNVKLRFRCTTCNNTTQQDPEDRNEFVCRLYYDLWTSIIKHLKLINFEAKVINDNIDAAFVEEKEEKEDTLDRQFYYIPEEIESAIEMFQKENADYSLESVFKQVRYKANSIEMWVYLAVIPSYIDKGHQPDPPILFMNIDIYKGDKLEDMVDG